MDSICSLPILRDNRTDSLAITFSHNFSLFPINFYLRSWCLRTLVNLLLCSVAWHISRLWHNHLFVRINNEPMLTTGISLKNKKSRKWVYKRFHSLISLAWDCQHRFLPVTVIEYLLQRRMHINLSGRSRLTTLVKSTITTFKGPLTQGGGDLWPYLGLFYEDFLGPCQMAKLSKGFFMRKICQQNGVVYFSYCEGEATVVYWIRNLIQTQCECSYSDLDDAIGPWDHVTSVFIMALEVSMHIFRLTEKLTLTFLPFCS